MLVRMIDALVPRDVALVVAVDDTFGRHTGKTIAAASKHRDLLTSSAGRLAFHWEHLWVVLGITVRLFDKTWCLPSTERWNCRAKRKRAERGRREVGVPAMKTSSRGAGRLCPGRLQAAEAATGYNVAPDGSAGPVHVGLRRRKRPLAATPPGNRGR